MAGREVGLIDIWVSTREAKRIASTLMYRGLHENVDGRMKGRTQGDMTLEGPCNIFCNIYIYI